MVELVEGSLRRMLEKNGYRLYGACKYVCLYVCMGEWASGWMYACVCVCMYGMYRVCTVQEGKDVKNYE